MKLAFAAKLHEKNLQNFQIYITICFKVATFPYKSIDSPFHQILASLRIVLNVHNFKKNLSFFYNICLLTI